MGVGMAKEPRQLMAGTVINGYRIERELGRGAMAVVYLATQLDLERPVALKVLSAELAADAEFVARFFNEARAAASMSHPHIVQAYDAGIAEGNIYYFCMEFVDGETLLQRLQRQKRLDAPACVAMALDIADALNFGWQRQKFTHGDIKPENIMINVHEQAKLADFGLAKVEGHDYDGTDIMLTPLYAPPELIRGERERKDCRSDIYAFGATLYHALAGTPPFPGDNAQAVLQRHLKEPLEPLRQRYPKAPQWFSDLVGRMLEKDPARRPQSWGEVIEGLKKIQRSLLMLKPDDASAENPGLRKAKIMRGAEKKLRGAPRIITPQERRSAARTNQGVVTMFVLALALSIGTVFLKRHIEQQQATAINQGATTQSMETTSPDAAENETTAKTEGTKTPATTPPADSGATPPPVIADGGETEPQPVNEQASAAPGATDTGQEGETTSAAKDPSDPATTVFALRLPDPAIPIELTDSQQQAGAMLDAAWCLSLLNYDFMSPAPQESLLRPVKDWLNMHPQPNELSDLMNYLRDSALPALAEARSSLTSKKARLIGHNFTGNRERQFMLQDVSHDKIEVQEQMANGHVVRTLSWAEVRAEGLVDDLFKTAFYVNESDPRQWRPYLAYLLCSNQPRALTATLAIYPQDNEEERHWKMLQVLQDMASGRKLEMLKAWQELRQACRMGLQVNAYRLASELRRSRNSVSINFADVLDSLMQRCSSAVPELQGAALQQRARQQLQAGAAEEALQLLLLAKARYGNVNFTGRNRLEDLQKEIVASLAAELDGQRLNLWNALPFAFSRPLQYSPQASYLVNVRLSQSSELPPMEREALAGLRPLSLLEMGDWLQTNRLTEDRALNALLKRTAPFRYPAHFGRALLIMRYGLDPAAADQEAQALTMSAPGLEKNPQLLSLAAEYILLSRCGDRERLYRFRSRRLNPDGRETAALRRRLCYLDLCLVLEGAGRKEAMDLLYKVTEDEHGDAAFNSDVLRADAHRMHEMIRLGNGSFFPPLLDNAWPELQLRLALACMGDRSLTGESDETFMQLVESEASRWSLIGGDMIYDWLLRRSAADIEIGDLAAATQRVHWALGLPHSCLFPYYGRLQLLSAGLYNLAGQNSGYMNAHLALQAATVASETEKRLIRLVYERDGGRALLAQLGDGHPGHFLVPWLELSLRLGRGDKVKDIEKRFGRQQWPMAERRLLASLNVFQREKEALPTAEQ
jgi:serine/threonine protein kinase